MDWIQILVNTASSIISPVTIAYALAAIGLSVHFGFAGLLNMGIAGFMAMGAYGYAISILTFGFPWWGGVLVGLAAGMLFALILGIPTLRLRGDYLAIVTIAAAEVVRLLFLTSAFDPVTGSADGNANTTPPRAPNTPPMMSACILCANTSLPSARTASSSSRMPLSTRPHGLDMIRQTANTARMSAMNPRMRTHHPISLNTHGPKP